MERRVDFDWESAAPAVEDNDFDWESAKPMGELSPNIDTSSHPDFGFYTPTKIKQAWDMASKIMNFSIPSAESVESAIPMLKPVEKTVNDFNEQVLGRSLSALTALSVDKPFADENVGVWDTLKKGFLNPKEYTPDRMSEELVNAGMDEVSAGALATLGQFGFYMGTGRLFSEVITRGKVGLLNATIQNVSEAIQESKGISGVSVKLRPDVARVVAENTDIGSMTDLYLKSRGCRLFPKNGTIKLIDYKPISPNEVALPKDLETFSVGKISPKTEVVKIDPLLESAKQAIAEGKSAEEFVASQFKKPSYGMAHRPTYEGMPPSYNLLEGDAVPKDVYEHPEYSIASGRNIKTDKAAKESWEALQKIKGKPESKITVYRAARKKELNAGDWVTFSKEYAEQSVEPNTPEKVFSFKVKAKDVIFAGDDINEFGYYPKSQILSIYEQAKGGANQPITGGLPEGKPKKPTLAKGGGVTVYRGDTSKINLKDYDVEKGIKDGKELGGAFAEGPGIYFTTKESNAKGYGANISTITIPETANIITDESPLISRSAITKMLKDVDSETIDIAYSNWAENKTEAKKLLIDALMNAENPKEQLINIWADVFYHQQPNKFMELMKQHGIDGIKVAKEGLDHYVIYNRDLISSKLSPKEGGNQPMAEGIPENEAKKPTLEERLTTVEEARDRLSLGGEVERYLLDNKIKKYADKFLEEEISALPRKYITTRTTANTIDQALDELRNLGYDFETENDLIEYLQRWESQKKELQSLIDENKPKKITRYETTIAKQEGRIRQQEKLKAEKVMRDMTEEQAKISERMAKRAFKEGKIEGSEIRKKKYFGDQISKDERKQLYLLAKQKGLIYTDYKGNEHNKLGSLLSYYKGSSFSQYKEYISNLTGDEQNPPLLVKMYGDITKDTELMKLLNQYSEGWFDINKIEVSTLDIPRIIEKVTNVDLWDGNILADNTFKVIADADEALFDRKVKEHNALVDVKKDIKANSKESAEIMRKFEKGESLTQKEQNVVDFLRKKYNEWISEMNSVRARLGKKAIPYRKDYMTHIQEQSLLDEFFGGDDRRMDTISEGQLDAIRKGDYTKGNMPFNKFAQKRLGDKTKYDAIGNYEKYLDTALKEIYYSEGINHARKFIQYALRKQPNAYKAVDRWLNDLKGKESIADQNLLGTLTSNKYVQKIRTQVAKNALVGNINFWATNLSNFSIAYDEIGNNLNVGIAKFLGDKKWRDFAFKHSQVLKGRSIDTDLDPTKLNNLQKTVSAITNLIEYNNVGSTFVGAYHKAINELKYDEKKAIRYADTIARRTQAGYKKYELNAWMRANNGKVLSQFQSWSFNMMNHVIYDLKAGNIPEDMVNFVKGKGDIKGTRWNALITLVVTSIIVNQVYEMMGLREPYRIESFVPVVPGFNWRYYDISPTRIINDLRVGLTSKDEDTRRKALIRATVMFGLPFGGAQASRFIDGTVFPKDESKKKEYPWD